MKLSKLVVLAVIAALAAGFFVLDLRQYVTLQDSVATVRITGSLFRQVNGICEMQRTEAFPFRPIAAKMCCWSSRWAVRVPIATSNCRR